MGTCRILNVSRVLIPPGPYPAPGETIQLSLFDSVWVSLPHIQRFFLYPDANVPFPSIVESLKSSLVSILPFFHPFAGKLTYIPSTCDAIIDCSPTAVGEGVAFIEAELPDIDIQRIAREENHDLEYFVQLVPDIFVEELPATVLAVQVTKFSNGGVAIGLAVHHTVSDGKGLWRFIEAWAAASLKGEIPPRPMPVHDRSVITYPGGNEIAKDFRRKMCPHLPKVESSKYSMQDRLRLVRRTFTIDKSKINLLKQKSGDEKPSTFVALSAQALVSIARARGLENDNGPFIIGFLTDCRSRLNPPIAEGYIGNCVSYCYAWSIASEIAGPDGFLRTCDILKEAIRKATEEPLTGCEGWVDEFMRLPAGRVVFLVGSPRFRAYETDFGWGKPGRVELASMNHDGEVVMLGGKDEGTIQASVALSAQHMDEFTRMFDC
ncbi:hypothetical protein LUZ60_005765 [Juncus effusus]|nr:hypothetical protein LUZ60_005765 [Juncus effusus]